MIRLTVLYNLPDGTDEDEFVAWRLGEHQDANATKPGVIHTDFGRIVKAWPDDSAPGHRFMTTVDWPDWETFRASFYDPDSLARLCEDVKRICDSVFLISEILIGEDGRNADPAGVDPYCAAARSGGHGSLTST